MCHRLQGFHKVCGNPTMISRYEVRVASHYGRPSREAVELNGQTLLRVQRNELKIANKIIGIGAFGQA